jgi:hypothetical protein
MSEERVKPVYLAASSIDDILSTLSSRSVKDVLTIVAAQHGLLVIPKYAAGGALAPLVNNSSRGKPNQARSNECAKNKKQEIAAWKRDNHGQYLLEQHRKVVGILKTSKDQSVREQQLTLLRQIEKELRELKLSFRQSTNGRPN